MVMAMLAQAHVASELPWIPVMLPSTVIFTTLTAILVTMSITPMALLALASSALVLSIAAFPTTALHATPCLKWHLFALLAGTCTTAPIARLRLVPIALGVLALLEHKCALMVIILAQREVLL